MTKPSKSLIQMVPWLSSSRPAVLYSAMATLVGFALITALVCLEGGDPWDGLYVIVSLSLLLVARQTWLLNHPKIKRDTPRQERLP